MKKLSILGVIVVLILTISSCTHNNTTVVVPIGQEQYIPATVQDFFEENGINIDIYEYAKSKYDSVTNWQKPFPTGVIAPKIEGQFEMNIYKNAYVTDPLYANMEMANPKKLYFYNQHNGFCSYRSAQGITTSYTDTVHIMGEENRFLVLGLDVVDDTKDLSGLNAYMKDPLTEEAIHIEEYSYYTKTLIVFVGEVVPDEGLKDCYFIRFVLESIDPGYFIPGSTTPQTGNKPVNTLEITYDKDGFSPLTEWYVGETK